MQVGSIAAVAREHYLIGAFLFSASLNHKQMSLYFAPAIFAHLLGRCLQQRKMRGKVRWVLSLKWNICVYLPLFLTLGCFDQPITYSVVLCVAGCLVFFFRNHSRSFICCLLGSIPFVHGGSSRRPGAHLPDAAGPFRRLRR